MTSMTKKIFCSDISLSGRAWAAHPLEEVTPPAGIGETAARIAAARGFDLQKFFDPKLKSEMPDPYKLKGMEEAVASFCDAIIADKKIAFYGDYDVDGATSTALMLRWVHAVGQDDAIYYIPNRLKEGYGPNPTAVRMLKEEEKVDMIVFLDSGTVAHDSLAVADELGMDIIIIDHHEPDSRDPVGLLVNPKQRGETREFEYLCTAGLAFLFLVAVQREMRTRNFFNDTRKPVDLMDWLGIVALGTICDLVPLVGLNRAYVASGLPRMDNIPGIRALADINSKGEFNRNLAYTEFTCGFVYGPSINAAGRIGDTRDGTLLLALDDHARAGEVAQRLHNLNADRKELTKVAQEKALADVAASMSEASGVVVYDPDWHPGIVGIVASRVKEATGKPTIAIGGRDGKCHGSCRSVEGFDISAVVIAAREKGLLIKGGGHKMAAGLSIEVDRIEEFRAFVDEACKGFTQPPLPVDLVVPCGKLSVRLLQEIEQLKPFGAGNMAPKIAVVNGFVSRVDIMKGKHIKLLVSGENGDCQAILWNGIGTPLGDQLAELDDCLIDMLGSGKVDTYGGTQRATLIIDDAMVSRIGADVKAA